MAMAMGSWLIKSSPLVEVSFQKCCQANTDWRTSEALHNGQHKESNGVNERHSHRRRYRKIYSLDDKMH